MQVNQVEALMGTTVPNVAADGGMQTPTPMQAKAFGIDTCRQQDTSRKRSSATQKLSAENTQTHARACCTLGPGRGPDACPVIMHNKLLDKRWQTHVSTHALETTL